MRRAMGLLLAAAALAGCADDLRDVAPDIRFMVDEENDRVVVDAPSRRADWNRLEARVVACAAHVEGLIPRMGTTHLPVDQPASSSGANLANPTSYGGCGTPVVQDLSSIQDPVRPGDFVAFCASPARVGELRDVVVWFTDWPAHGVAVLEARFTSLAACQA